MLCRRLITIIIALILTACTTTPRQSSIDNKALTASPSPGPSSTTVATDTTVTSEEIHTTEKHSASAYADAWDRIRKNLQLDTHADQRNVKYKLAWFVRNQDYLDRVATRAEPYLHHIISELEKRGMPLDLALLPVVESAYHPFAYSPSHASGIWQFIPSTGKHYGLKQNWWYDGRRDIVAATTAALDYLEKLHKDFNGDWLLALAAYNSGELNVARAIRRNKRNNKPTDFWHLHLPRETKGYVPSLLAVAELISDPAGHGITLISVPDKPYFSIVDTGGQLDLAVAAKLANLSMDEIYNLNPGFNRWATDPEGPHTLLVPLDREQQFRDGLANLSEDQRVSWKRHVVSQGETLSLIATRYHTDISTLKRANQLHGNLIRTGHSLLIPSSQLPLKNYTLSLDIRRFAGLKRADGQRYIYTIRRGDTLWDISRHYGVSVRDLCQWNGISPNRILRPGQSLDLWLAGQEQTSGTNTKVSHNVDNTQKVSYTVKRGDSLWLISRRFGVTVAQLMKWNKLSRSNLRPGQKLILLNPGTTGA